MGSDGPVRFIYSVISNNLYMHVCGALRNSKSLYVYMCTHVLCGVCTCVRQFLIAMCFTYNSLHQWGPVLETCCCVGH